MCSSGEEAEVSIQSPASFLTTWLVQTPQGGLQSLPIVTTTPQHVNSQFPGNWDSQSVFLAYCSCAVGMG